MTSAGRGKARVWLLSAVGVLTLAFLVLPTLLVVPMSFSPSTYMRFPPAGFSVRWYVAYFTDPSWIDATLFSIQVGLMATAVSVVAGTMAALALVRGRVPGRDAVTSLLLAPLIVPHVVVAIAVYLQLSPLGLLGTRLAFVLIHASLAVPYVILVVTAALQRVPATYEMAGLNLGGSQIFCFRNITFPLIAPSVAAGAIFAFLASFDETVVSFFISGVSHKTVTRKLMEDIEFNLSPLIAAASTVFVAVSVLLMWSGTFLRRDGGSAGVP